MSKHRIQQHTNQITTPDHKKNRFNTSMRSKLAETITNYHQQNFTGQRPQPIRSTDTHNI